MSTKPILIGITGGIGSGKSTVCHIFEVLGVPVYYADERAKALVEENEGLKQNIIHHFGEESFLNGHYNRSYISSIVFQAPDRLKKLNALIHPAVAFDFDFWVNTQGGQYPYLVKEAALLLEAGHERNLDKIFTVTAPKDMRMQRVMARDAQRSVDQVKAIIARQMTEEEQIKKSDGILDNSGLVLLIPQVLAIHQSLR